MRSERGFSLIEVLMSLAVIGIIGVGILSSLGTSSTITLSEHEREIAKNLAESQFEYVKDQAFAASYAPAPIPPENAGYSASMLVESVRDSNIQKITVTIEHYATEIMRLEGYKVR